MKKLGFGSDNVEILNTELFVVKLSARKADLIIKLDNMYLIIEFQSSYVGHFDEKRFSTYAHMFDLNKDDDLPVFLCVLSTVEESKTKRYRINDKSVFTFSIVSLKDEDEGEIINNVCDKINSNQYIPIEELVDFALLLLITKDRNKEKIFTIVENGLFEYNFSDLETRDFVFGIELLLSNKLLSDGSFKKHLEAKLMGQLECVSRYVEEQVSKRVEEEMNEYVKKFNQEFAEQVTREVTEKVTKENSERIAINLLNTGNNINFVAHGSVQNCHDV